MKLFEIASSLADLIATVPFLSQSNGSGIGPRDMLVHLGATVGSFRGGTSAVRSLMQQKMLACGLDVARYVDVEYVEDGSHDTSPQDSNAAVL